MEDRGMKALKKDDFTIVWALIISLVLVLGWAPPALAETYVGGIITSDTVWTLGDSPYIVINNVLIRAGVTLTIEPGVIVRFNQGLSLRTDGTLIARGTATEMVTFTSNKPSPAPGDWGGLIFTDTSRDALLDSNGNYIAGCILENVVVEYGGGDSVVQGAVHASQSSPLITNSILRNNAKSGIYVYSGSPKIIGNTVSNNSSYGVYIYNWGDLVDIADNNISNNALGGIYIYGASGSIRGNLINENGDCGVRLIGYSGEDVTVSENIISKNDSHGIRADGSYFIKNNFIIYNKADGIRMDSDRGILSNIIADNTGRGYSSDVWLGPLLAI